MLSQTQSVNNFTKNCDELISSNYILATKKISDLLKGLSSSKIFMELFEYLTSDFDYESAKARALKTKSFEGGGFCVPTDRQEFLALVFLLLCEIDMEKIKFIDFIMLYFNGGGYKESYVNFCQKLIAPFKNEVLFAIKQMRNTEALDERFVTVKPVKQILNKQTVAELDELLCNSKNTIFQYKMDLKDKNDIFDLYKNFANALHENDALRIKTAFLGYKYATIYQRKPDVFMTAIEKILKENGILDN